MLNSDLPYVQRTSHATAPKRNLCLLISNFKIRKAIYFLCVCSFILLNVYVFTHLVAPTSIQDIHNAISKIPSFAIAYFLVKRIKELFCVRFKQSHLDAYKFVCQ